MSQTLVLPPALPSKLIRQSSAPGGSPSTSAAIHAPMPKKSPLPTELAGLVIDSILPASVGRRALGDSPLLPMSRVESQRQFSLARVLPIGQFDPAVVVSSDAVDLTTGAIPIAAVQIRLPGMPPAPIRVPSVPPKSPIQPSRSFSTTPVHSPDRGTNTGVGSPPKASSPIVETLGTADTSTPITPPVKPPVAATKSTPGELRVSHSMPSDAFLRVGEVLSPQIAALPTSDISSKVAGQIQRCLAGALESLRLVNYTVYDRGDYDALHVKHPHIVGALRHERLTGTQIGGKSHGVKAAGVAKSFVNLLNDLDSTERAIGYSAWAKIEPKPDLLVSLSRYFDEVRHIALKHLQVMNPELEVLALAGIAVPEIEAVKLCLANNAHRLGAATAVVEKFYSPGRAPRSSPPRLTTDSMRQAKAIYLGDPVLGLPKSPLLKTKAERQAEEAAKRAAKLLELQRELAGSPV